jgi:hypothetical protein
MWRVLALALALGFVATAPAMPQYPYAGSTFRAWVAESYREHGSGDPARYFAAMDSRLQKADGRTWPQAIAGWKRQLAGLSGESRAAAEIRIATDAHRAIKRTVTKFSLDRGFEFALMEQNNERQCFSQSVMLTGLLQAAGLNAGVVMVYKNPKGQESNNGHAITLLRLASGRDVQVDCSHADPFTAHQGLFVARGDTFGYVLPQMQKPPVPLMSAYDDPVRDVIYRPGQLQPLDLPFLNSMFDYYRGERVPGGLLDPKAAPAGLQRSLSYLVRATQDEPRNPLPWSVRARVELRLGQRDAAQRSVRRAMELHNRFGFMPGGIEALDRQIQAEAGGR